MPLESPPVASKVNDFPELDEFLGFSYVASPSLSLHTSESTTKTSIEDHFLGFSYVAMHQNSLKAKAISHDNSETDECDHGNVDYLSSDEEYIDS